MSKLQAIHAAVKPYIHRTPLWHSATLSAMTGHEVWVKAEMLQKTGSFKPRGMVNKMLSLSPEEKARGAITFSAGNMAQGLAYGAAIAKMKAVVVMAANASRLKAEATRGYGAEVVLHGDTAEAHAHCLALAEKHGYTLVLFDDPAVMEGHGTIGLEILEDLPDVDAVVSPIGGGGLISGIIMALRASGSKARIFGVEPEGADVMRLSVAAGKPVRAQPKPTIADGLAPPFAGERSFPYVRDHAEPIVLVSEAQIGNAIALLLSRMKLLAEGAGAASLAGLLTGTMKLPPRSKVVCVLSGGNIDPERLKSVL
ncbi:MAG: pyridoxal-phosphate dependent enzyme [Rhodospirillaceae bacterium]|nr:pyridoxal-phosphate dependent enzyme [Rhodospirillaceae bacterium]